ncbi:MAG: hypothetical protein ACOX3A_03270 [bacterium]
MGYPIVDESLQMRWEYVDPLAIWQMVLGVIAVLLVMEGCPPFLGAAVASFGSSYSLVYMFFGECDSGAIRSPRVSLHGHH